MADQAKRERATAKGASTRANRRVISAIDARLQKEKKKALLLIDNCPSHPNPLPITLTNLEVKFLPKNTTSKLQPWA